MMGGSVNDALITENDNVAQNRWGHVQTSGSNLSSFFIATSIAVLCFVGSTPNFAIAAAVVKNRNGVRFRKNHFFVIVAFHSLFRGVYLLFYGSSSVLYALASLGWTWTAVRPWACWTFVVNGLLFAEYYNGFTFLALALDRHMSVSAPIKYAHLPLRLGWLVSGLIGLLVLVTRVLPIYAWPSTYDRTWDYCIGISSVMSPLGVVVHRFVVCFMYLVGLLIYFHLMYVAHRKKSIMAAMSAKKVAVIPAITVLKVKENTTRTANMSGMYSATKFEPSFIGANSPPADDGIDGVASNVDVARPRPSKQRTQLRRRAAHTSLINVIKMIIFSYTISTTFICILALIDYDSPWAESRVIFYLLSFTLVISKLCDSLILILRSSVLRSAVQKMFADIMRNS